jgi:hypothetical protein
MGGDYFVLLTKHRTYIFFRITMENGRRLFCSFNKTPRLHFLPKSIQTKLLLLEN